MEQQLFLLFVISVAIMVFFTLQKLDIKSTPMFKHYISGLPTDLTLEGLHTKIWKQIESLQEDGNCEEKKILHCENIGSYAGLGSMMMRYGTCMQVAFGLGRMFFIEQKEYAHFGGLFRFLKNESSRCGYLKETYRNSKSICNMHDSNCYLENGYDVNNSYKVLELNTNMRYPAPRRIPSSLPLEIERKLKELNVRLPWLWFTSQFLGYLFLRLQNDTEKKLHGFKSQMNFSYPIAAMHIRHGKDKIGHESVFIQNEKYLSWVDKYFQKFLPNATKHNLYIASDDKDILDQLKSVRPNYDYFQLPREYVDSILPKYKTDKEALIYKKPGFPAGVIESIIVEMHFLVYSNYTVCLLSSNVCRLAWSLKLATPPYRHNGRIISADGGVLGIYWWFGYVAPLHDHFVPIRSFQKDVTFADGKRMMNYTKGMLIVLRGAIKEMTVDNIVYSVRWGGTAYLRGGNKAGYVSVKDVVRWPGRPSYHFYE